MVLNCDYLVLGAGAQGLAFTDALLAENPSCKVIIVDNRSDPGGEWNDTYAFARLDQPSIFFGVPSQAIEETEVDSQGKKVAHASRDQILLYFRSVMDHLTADKKVRYFPNCNAEILGSGWGCSLVRLTPLLKSDQLSDVKDVNVNRKVIDSTYATIPKSLTSRVFPFEVDDGVRVVRPHDLTFDGTAQSPMYVVIGAGKSGIDTVLWLLSHQIPPEIVHWVMPRDSWYFTSESMQAHTYLDTILKFREHVACVPSTEALMLALEGSGGHCRIDKQRFPEIFHGLSLSKHELAALRSVQNIIRLGHVKKITTERLELDNGFAMICAGALCIDCASQGRNYGQEVVPIFSQYKIILQSVGQVSAGPCELNVSYSAAFIGFMEGLYSGTGDLEKKNSFCTPVPFPDLYSDWFKVHLSCFQHDNFWDNRRIVMFITERPSRFSAMTPQELLKLKSTKAQADYALANLRKILSIENPVPPVGPDCAQAQTAVQTCAMSIPKEKLEANHDNGVEKLQEHLDVLAKEKIKLEDHVAALEKALLNFFGSDEHPGSRALQLRSEIKGLYDDELISMTDSKIEDFVCKLEDLC